MTYMEFFGCAFTAFGPAFAMFYWTIMHDPIRIIILIASSFFWLCSLLFSSSLWFIFPNKDWVFFGVLTSIFFQEIFRYLVYKILRKSEQGLRQVTETNSAITTSTHLLSYVSGLGFGIISGAFSLVNILAEIKGPGTMGLHGGNEYFCLFSALFTMCFVFLHTFWSIIFFNGFDTHNRMLVLYVIISHVFVSCITLLNRDELYGTTVSFIFIITIISGVLSYRIAGGTKKSFTVLFQFQRKSSVNIQ
ncbi:hypothetical protein PGB90_009079 [Kerria lacca]